MDALSYLDAEPVEETHFEPPHLSSWLWKPWYAKLWWASIPLYWIGLFASQRVPVLSAFYGSALAGYLNLVFMPFTALLILGFGYLRARLELIRSGEDPKWEPSDNYSDCESGIRVVHGTHDIYDPWSGTAYVGNILSSNNGSRH